MLKKSIHGLCGAGKARFPATFIFNSLPPLKMAAHPCAANRLRKNSVFQQPVKVCGYRGKKIYGGYLAVVYLQKATITWLAILLSLLLGQAVYAEGSAQAGLNQRLNGFQVSSQYLHVDIQDVGEVINISVCGLNQTDILEIEILDPLDNTVDFVILNGGNVSCAADPLNAAAVATPHKYTATQIGAYKVRLDNVTAGSLNLLSRYDVSVTPDSSIPPDPAVAAGRLWSVEWWFNAGGFAETDATDADFFILAPGGRPNTNYVWKLDLNKLAGYSYKIIANDVGVDAPYSGYSVANSAIPAPTVTPKFPIYFGYPAVANPRPTTPPTISNLRFVDNAGVDNSISPSTTPGIQDSGFFEFNSDVSGTYAITIDTSGDGQFGASDVLLLGNAVAGFNQIAWDGRNAAGNMLPSGSYSAQVAVRLGEYHFVAEDVETSGGPADPGFTIFLANSDGSTSDTEVYWDDNTYLGGSTTLPGGALSSTPAGRHTWGDFTASSLGNESFIDTYVYGLVSTDATSVTIANSDDVDSDGDGILDSVDLDDDNDGIPDVKEGPAGTDTDGDGIPDTLDLDSDNDGILDAVESGAPAQTLDSNGRIVGAVGSNGLIDALESDDTSSAVVTYNSGEPVNTDGTDAPDFRDLDSDNDGVNDVIEAGGPTADPDGDGLVGSGIPSVNSFGVAAGAGLTPPDTDGDGNPDFRDVVGDTNSDHDADGIPDPFDLDDDNDGIPDLKEGPAGTDTDGDGIIDTLDLDSDNDGIHDALESGASGVPVTAGRITGAVGINGLPDAVETAAESGITNYNNGEPVNTDGDGVADFRDLDSDNDGITDVIEAGGADPDRNALIGSGAPPAVDGNGVATGVGAGMVPLDTDNDSTPDYRDLDTDNDGINDVVEAGFTDDGNGMLSGFSDSSPLDGLDDNIAIKNLANLPDDDGDGTPDFRDDNDNDADNDGVDDAADIDDDNDGILDSAEQNGGNDVDTDGDGIVDRLDLDSDNDGILDARESGADPAGLTITAAGRIDISSNPVGANGLVNSLEDVDSPAATVNYNGGNPVDTDGDGVEDFRDLDSDNDGIADVIEAGGSDPDSNALIGSGAGSGLPVNGVGVATALSAGGLLPPDTDGDGTHDFRDLDSDADGINDVIEAGGSDPDGNGLVGSGSGEAITVDANGLATGLAAGGLVPPDSDGDGTPDYQEANAPAVPHEPPRLETGLDGGLGCTLSNNRGIDPVFPLLVMFALLYLLRGRTGKPATAVSAAGLMAAGAAALLAVTPPAAADTEFQSRWYGGLGAGISELKPDPNTTVYTNEETRSSGGKLFLGYDWSERVSIEGYYSDLGEAKIGSTDPNVPGGDIAYRDYGLSALYYLFKQRKAHEGFGVFGRIGFGKMENETDLPYTRLNDNHMMLGAGLEYAFRNGFALRGELDYYDTDSQLLALSLLKRFGGSEPREEPAPPPPAEPEPVPVAPPPPPPAPKPEPAPVAKLGELGIVYFATDSAELSADARATLDRVAAELQRVPAARVEVQGNTDSRASDAYNRDLSARRARAVIDYLAGKGIARDRMEPLALGESNPTASNATAEGRRLNRRVEFRELRD